ncbi:hypothetical protein BDN71DRAFT_1430290 [Pleurotus eryngii]|uniref:TEA domain-containing protein n=1 Tax=Pleurotus eryngii TaxID=5323 RepID=A0A9P5ZZ56_PLEER|nr:hypothetical protein BDN71DRAFT_1430290 [Pleurotus eryngii]
MTGTALLPSALPSSLGAASPSGPSSTTLEVFHSIVKGRKSWKTLRGNGEAVWPPELEAALLEGLESYQPDDSRETRLLGRFPMRNRYISDYIWKVTGKRRTAKQVGSRLQQLRDTCGGKRLEAESDVVVLALLSPCKRQVPAHRSTPALMREQQRGGALDCASPLDDSSPFSSSSTTAPSSSSSTTTSPLVICIDLLPPSSPLPSPATSSTPVQDSTGTFHAAQPRPIKSIDPTVTFLSQQHIHATSHYTVYQHQQHQGHQGQGENAVVFSESTPLVLVPHALPAAEGETLVYSTALVPGFWSEIADAHDPTHYTIHQEIIKQVPSSPSSLPSPTSPTSPASPSQLQSSQVLMFSAIYKFKFAEPAAHFSMGMGMGMSLYEERPSTSSSSTSLDSLDSLDSMDSMDSFASYTTDATHSTNSTTPTSTSSSPTVHPRSLSSPTSPSSPSSPTSPPHTYPSTPSPTSRTHTNKISLPLPPSLSLSLPLSPSSPSSNHPQSALSALSPSSPPPTASTSGDEAFDYFLPVDIDVTQFVADPFSAHTHPSHSAQHGYVAMMGSNMGMGGMGMNMNVNISGMGGGMGMGMDINGMIDIDPYTSPSSSSYMDSYAHHAHSGNGKHQEESFYELSSEPGVYDSANAGWGIGGHQQQSQVHEVHHQQHGFGQEYSAYVL